MLINEVFSDCFSLLKPGGYCAIFIGNMYHNGRYHLLNADVSHILSQIGFILKGEIIWYDVNKKLHLYGINYSWIPSIVHQFIMIFRKERINNLTNNEKEIIRIKNLERIKDEKSN
ncbi:MAG: DNA methyltransferase [Candidatus Thorarchaeota archaeon]